MESQKDIDFKRIATAIEYLQTQFREQPDLETVAAQVHLSPFHFQRMFHDWAGVTPKQFMQHLSIGYAKQLLQQNGVTLFDAAFETGLSGTGRLHDLFVKIEGMTPGEYKNGGAGLQICYSFAQTTFGLALVASTRKGVCYLSFADEGTDAAFTQLRLEFPRAAFLAGHDPLHEAALRIFSDDWSRPDEVRLHLRGTPFQLQVWQALLQVPEGKLTSYAQVAASIDRRPACRAVGSAIGDNPIAYIIPCHRVIKASGAIGQYRWGHARKQAMIGWEAVRAGKDQEAG